MIVVTVTFQLAGPVLAEDMQRLSRANAEKFLGMAGLIRKYYVRSEDGTSVGGVYLWASRSEAEAFYTDAWSKAAQAAYGSVPAITYLDCPVVVDNTTSQIIA